MRLIDADELKRAILFERDKIPFKLPGATYELGICKPNHHGNSMRGGIRKALRCMEQCKTVDAVPVVRCKDCKHYDKNALWCDINSFIFSETHYNWYEEDFCSYGERKNDG